MCASAAYRARRPGADRCGGRPEHTDLGTGWIGQTCSNVVMSCGFGNRSRACQTARSRPLRRAHGHMLQDRIRIMQDYIYTAKTSDTD